MKKIACYLFSFLNFWMTSISAKTVNAKASTIDSAEAKIAQQANLLDKSYKIPGAHSGNYVHMIAKLVSQ